MSHIKKEQEQAIVFPKVELYEQVKQTNSQVQQQQQQANIPEAVRQSFQKTQSQINPNTYSGPNYDDFMPVCLKKNIIFDLLSII